VQLASRSCVDPSPRAACLAPPPQAGSPAAELMLRLASGNRSEAFREAGWAPPTVHKPTIESLWELLNLDGAAGSRPRFGIFDGLERHTAGDRAASILRLSKPASDSGAADRADPATIVSTARLASSIELAASPGLAMPGALLPPPFDMTLLIAGPVHADVPPGRVLRSRGAGVASPGPRPGCCRRRNYHGEWSPATRITAARRSARQAACSPAVVRFWRRERRL